MQANKEINQHYKTISSTCYIANIAYLFLRVFYLVLFIVAKLPILIWIDVGTIVFYLLCFLLIKNKKYYLYALLCGNEFFAFIIVASLMIGFHTGFHFYLIGLCVVSFFTSYFSKKKRILGSIIWAGLSLVIYLVLYFVTSINPSYYAIEKWLEMTLVITHVIVVFLFVVFYLFIFIRYALSLEKRILNESRTDELTQIGNRYALYDYFSKEENKDARVLALFDIDDFKKINDVYGHIVGDYLLKKVAEIATESLSDNFVCRYGGEEFVTVLGKENYFEKLEQLRKALEDYDFEYEGNKYKLTITIGAAPYQEGIELEKWVDLADEKMYFGKNNGKNQIVH